jgi:hypothetical protein
LCNSHLFLFGVIEGSLKMRNLRARHRGKHGCDGGPNLKCNLLLQNMGQYPGRQRVHNTVENMLSRESQVA